MRRFEKKVSAFGGTTWIAEIYDNPYELLQTDNKRECLPDPRFKRLGPDGVCDYSDRLEFYGVKNWDEATDLLMHGYNPMAKELKDVRPNIVGEGKRIAFKNSVEGFAPVVPLALMGVPNSMIAVRMKPIKAKVLNIYFDSGMTSRVTPAQCIRAGKQLLRVLLSLEQSGYKFNLYSTFSFSQAYSNKGHALYVKIKSSGQPLDLKKMSFMLAHPAALRVFAFDWYSRLPGGVYIHNYGSPLSSRGFSADAISTGLSDLAGQPGIALSVQTIINMGDDAERIAEYLKQRITGGRK